MGFIEEFLLCFLCGEGIQGAYREDKKGNVYCSDACYKERSDA